MIEKIILVLLVILWGWHVYDCHKKIKRLENWRGAFRKCRDEIRKLRKEKLNLAMFAIMKDIL